MLEKEVRKIEMQLGTAVQIETEDRSLDMGCKIAF
jgi:hypothetical protein